MLIEKLGGTISLGDDKVSQLLTGTLESQGTSKTLQSVNCERNSSINRGKNQTFTQSRQSSSEQNVPYIESASENSF